MRRLSILLLQVLLLSTGLVCAQKSFNDFVQAYPIGDEPNMRYLSSYTKQETMLFEANPIVRYSFYNNFVKSLMNDSTHMQGWYISFRPQLRMYTDNSKPVKTPSYRTYLGTQHMFRLPNKSDSTQQFLGFSLESGHYSNGQVMSAFSEKYPDGSKESDSIYNTITSATKLSDILNRNSGNFSTNLTELILNYRCYGLDDNYQPKSMHSINLGYTLYHDLFLGLLDFGGYSDQDIKLYGKHRFLLTYEYMRVFEHWKNRRLNLKQSFEWIEKPHASVNRLRMESSCTLYPFSSNKTMGVVASYIYGHDNYNFRFVDSGHQFSVGLCWSQFPLFQMKR